MLLTPYWLRQMKGEWAIQKFVDQAGRWRGCTWEDQDCYWDCPGHHWTHLTNQKPIMLCQPIRIKYFLYQPMRNDCFSESTNQNQVPLLSSSTFSWMIWLMVRSTIHKPNLARIIPSRNTETDPYFIKNSLLSSMIAEVSSVELLSL